MGQIFWGLLLVFFDIRLHITTASGPAVNLIGYILILDGVRRLSPRSEWFARGRLPALLLAGCMALQFIASLFRHSAADALPLLLRNAAGLALLLLELLLLYTVTYGMADLEMGTGGGEMRTTRLTFLWKIMAALFLLTLITGWAAPGLAVLFRVCALAACVCYLAFFHTSWKVYQDRSA